MPEASVANWPGGAQCAAVFSFDMDADSIALAYDREGHKRPGMRSVGKYGPRVAVFEIIDLFKEYDLPATFFVPGWVIDHYTEAVAAVCKAGFEVSCHSYHHTRLYLMSPDEEDDAIARGIEAIQRVTGRRPPGFRAPSWEFSERTLSFLYKYGFDYSSNMMDSIFPYFHPALAGQAGIVELPVQWILDDALFFMTLPGVRFGPVPSARAVSSIWREEFSAIYKRGGLFMLTMHPHLVRPSRLEMLRRFIQYVSKHPKVWFARAESVAQHCRASTEGSGL